MKAGVFSVAIAGCGIAPLAVPAPPLGRAPDASAPGQEAWAARAGGLIDDARLERCARVGGGLLAALPDVPAGRPVRWHVLNTDAPCAYAWPGGHVYVTRGLIDRLDDEELAAALAHEIGHLLNDGRLAPSSPAVGSLPVGSLPVGSLRGGPGGIGVVNVSGIAATPGAPGAATPARTPGERFDREAGADATGCRLLSAAGLPFASMARMLEHVARATPDDACRAALRRRAQILLARPPAP